LATAGVVVVVSIVQLRELPGPAVKVVVAADDGAAARVINPPVAILTTSADLKSLLTIFGSPISSI
jgi:hypothetical protein